MYYLEYCRVGAVSKEVRLPDFSAVQIETYAVVAVALVEAGIAAGIVSRRARRARASAQVFVRARAQVSMSTWRSYLKGQGTLLLGFLLVGMTLALVASYYGPWEGRTAKGGRLIEYRAVNPSEHVVYEEQDVENYARVAVLARTLAPQNGSATITVYGDPKGGGKQEISRIESVGDSWSLWTQPQNLNKHITLKITNGGTGPGATQVDVLLYFFPQ